MVTVSEGNTELPDNSLIVQGYDVTGSIKSDGEPVKGVYVILFKMDNVIIAHNYNYDIFQSRDIK